VPTPRAYEVQRRESDADGSRGLGDRKIPRRRVSFAERTEIRIRQRSTVTRVHRIDAWQVKAHDRENTDSDGLE